eukprot:TRINITY_DN5063_c0_g1_i1.p1 TRINITY_DN5063_c0_g1~~TRINITY_DN5063_c0_g1_i1.p1  ORF type:complete len:367 (+),score=80.22 TRINITY_DN5063_c0_g1_i1:100-1101(+)
MGANTIRTYGFFNPYEASKYSGFLDACYSRGIMVMAGFNIASSTNFSDSSATATIVSNWSKFVTQFKNHPAILLWLFGNELNTLTTDYDTLFSVVSQATAAAHSAEGSSFHPVATPLADGNLTARISTYDSSVDLWAVQIYRGSTFGSLWSTLQASTSKPAIVTEFGVDAYDNNSQSENQTAQAFYESALFSEILANNATCSGGNVFQWLDGWWKAGNNSYQLTTGSTCNAPNDKVCNLAWYGINSISSGTPNVITQRQTYSSLKALYTTANPYGTSSSSSSSSSTGLSSAAVGGIVAGCLLGCFAIAGAVCRVKYRRQPRANKKPGGLAAVP